MAAAEETSDSGGEEQEDVGSQSVPLWERFLGKGWLWGRDDSDDEVANKDEDARKREWQWERHWEKVNTKHHNGVSYNLYHQWYYYPEDHPEEPRWYLLRSGLPFPSYHSNPTRNFPPRVSLIEGARDPCEEIRAPRIRLAPAELVQRKYFLQAIQRKGDETEEPPQIKTLNLSYQNLGEDYQYEQLLGFLKINKGCTVLALTDDFLTDLNGMDLPYLEELYLARNNFLSFKDIPALPGLVRLSIEENFITNLDGLNHTKFPHLVQLTLKWNPIAEDKHYRQKVREALPELRMLDNIGMDLYLEY